MLSNLKDFCIYSAGRYEVDGYVYNSADEPQILMTGKWNEFMSYQVCDSEGELLPGTELKEVRYSTFYSVTQVFIDSKFAMLSLSGMRF